MVASRDENNPGGTVEWKAVEELFQHTAGVISLTVNGREIRTTSEHPFYHAEKGWLPAGDLVAGDRLVGQHGEVVIVNKVEAGSEHEAVYNLRVADWHTYFVGDEGWGFRVWAHNAEYHSEYFKRKDAAYERYLSRANSKGEVAIGKREWKNRFDEKYNAIFIRNDVQNHHLITNKMIAALEKEGVEWGRSLRGRHDLQYKSSRGGHIGYEEWHRVLDEDMNCTPNVGPVV